MRSPPQALRYSVTTHAPPSPRLCCSATRAPSTCRAAGGAAQLVHQLVALRQTGGAERVALRQQAARRIGHDLAAVGVVAVGDEARALAFRAQAERLVGDELVLREAVVQLDDVDVVGADAGLLVHLRAAAARRHVAADDPHHVARLEGRRGVGGHRLRGDRDVGAQAVALREGLRTPGPPRRRRRSAGTPSGASSRPARSPATRRTSSARDLLAEHGERIAAPRGGSPWRGPRRRSRASCRTSACAASRRRRSSAARAGARAWPTSSSVTRVELVERRRAVVEQHAERARAASARSRPPARSRRRRWRPPGGRGTARVEPVEQLLLTLTTGMPVMPTR